MAESPTSDFRFRRLFDASEPAMRAYCRRRLGVQHANDAAAEIFLIAWRRIDDIPGGDAALLWLYGVARNVVRNARRSDHRQLRLGARVRSVGQTASPGPEDQVVRRVEDGLVLEAMATLSEDDQELLRLRTWEDLSRTELSAVYGISPEAIDMRLLRAKKRLAKALQRLGFGDRDASSEGRGPT